MPEDGTIRNLLELGANEAPAIGSPEDGALDFAGLRALADATVRRLNGLGVGRGDRVAIVLPNGPRMAAVFVAVGCGAVTAPLNPSYREDEFQFFLNDLNAKAIIVEKGSKSLAALVARKLGIELLHLVASPGGTRGGFTLEAGDCGNFETNADGMASAEDVALVLHTSGTTSRPKIVPLTQRNVVASARNIGASLDLVPGDRCLNIMPLFHIHGLVGAVLASLAAGASVHCTPGFNALRVFGWMDEVAPSWYTAVPTMHQAVLARASRNRESVRRARESLRFIRSSSSSLSARVMAELEKTFDVPVIESYGMTEAAHQMTSNPLPPAVRRPGSVGMPEGPEVAVMNETGDTFLGPSAIGEIVIRGENVTPGYENNPDANAAAFVDGWFRTGDQGFMDSDGYLTITGRLKEIINRGGEKISPREIDEVLIDHPAIAQVVTFAMPHEKLGEEVAAAVVLAEGQVVRENEIREFATSRLADFKIPRKLVVLDEIPKGATGKLQRIGLAAKLGLA